MDVCEYLRALGDQITVQSVCVTLLWLLLLFLLHIKIQDASCRHHLTTDIFFITMSQLFFYSQLVFFLRQQYRGSCWASEPVWLKFNSLLDSTCSPARKLNNWLIRQCVVKTCNPLSLYICIYVCI